MSTTTTFKRLALVTVAALGFGVLSTVAPASAAVAMDTLAVTDGTGSVGDSVTATSATTTITFLPSAGSDSMSVTASLVSGPAGNTQFPVLQLAETTSANVNEEAVYSTGFAAYTPVYVQPKTASVTTSAKFNVYLGTHNTTAGVALAGTYVVRITPAGLPTAGTATFKDITITIAAATQSSSLSTAYITSGTGTLYGPETDTVKVVAANTAGTGARVASIEVTQIKASGAAANESMTATITGAGTLGYSTVAGGGSTSAGRSLLVKTNGAGVSYISIFGDGTSGVATITITGVTSGTVIGTKTVLFSGTTIASLTAKAVNSVVGTVSANTGAVSVVAKDVDGNQIYDPTIYTNSDAKTVISNSYSDAGCEWDSTDLVTYCDVTSVSAGTANITFTNRASATATTPTTAVVSNAVALRVGSTTPASMKLTTDKASYSPGEKITLTLTVLDSKGLQVVGASNNTQYPNIFAAGGISSDYAFYTGSDTLTAVFAQLDPETGLKTWTLFAPLQAAEVTLTAVPGASFPATYQIANALGLTAKISVGNAAGVDAATDAAQEATDAANAATDAALQAADDAAAASAAVAKLSKSVNKALKALKKQITALTALVNKLL